MSFCVYLSERPSAVDTGQTSALLLKTTLKPLKELQYARGQSRPHPVILPGLDCSSPAGNISNVLGAQPAIFQPGQRHRPNSASERSTDCQRFHLQAQ